MAEVFGVVSGAAGLISLLIQVNTGFEILHNARKQFSKAPEELTLLEKELRFLALAMERMIQAARPSDHPFLAHCEASYAQKAKGAKKLLKVLDFKDWKADLNILRTLTEGALTKLSLVSSFQSHTSLNELTLVHQVTQSQEALTRQSLESFPNTLATSHSQSLEMFNRKHGRRRRQNCSVRECTCSCHRKEKAEGRFWILQYTSLAAFRGTCDNKTCTGTTYGVSMRLALSELGLRWATVVQFYIFAATGTFSLRPSLQVEPVVPDSSPGFGLLDRLDLGRISFIRAKRDLLRLHHNDPHFVRHVNTAGVSYLEYFLNKLKQWHFRTLDSQCLEFFNFLSVDLALLCHSNLSRVLKWSMEIDCLYMSTDFVLLKTFLDAGLDPLECDIPNETLHRPDADTSQGCPYDEALKLICPLNPGFLGMTPLHEAVLLDYSPDIVQYWVERSELDVCNYFGQTPLHLAATHRPEVLSLLIQAGHDVNTIDNYNHTPLEYAAAAAGGNFEGQCTAALVKAGIEMEPDKELVHRLWPPLISLAMEYGDVSTVTKGLRKLKQSGLSSLAQILAQVALSKFMQDDEKTSEGSSVNQTALDDIIREMPYKSLELGVLESGDEETVYASLLQFVTCGSHIKTLKKYGFAIRNYTNGKGQNAFCIIETPTQTSPMPAYPGIIDAMLTCGVDPNHKDVRDHTPLYHVLGTSRTEGELAIRYLPLKPLFEASSILLRSGVDPSVRDNCKCSCSPEGCLPAAALNATGKHWALGMGLGRRLPLWTLEYLHMLEEYHPLSAAHESLLAIIRKAKHEELGMTHLCCQRMGEYQEDAEPLDVEDADEILEEEDDFVQILEQEIASHSANTYEELMVVWFSQIKEFLHLDLSDNHAVTSLAENICFYALDLEMLRQDTSWLFTTNSNSERDRWYKRRRDRLFQLIGVLSIPEEIISDEYRELTTSLYTALNYDEAEHERLVDRFMLEARSEDTTTGEGHQMEVKTAASSD